MVLAWELKRGSLMATAVLTTKGQVTIPIEIREELGLHTGDKVEFIKNPATGKIELERKTASVMNLFGMLKYDGPPVSIEEMNEAVREHVVREDERIKREWREEREKS